MNEKSLNLFEPFYSMWYQIIQAVKENKKLPYHVLRFVTARITGKTWTCMHVIIALVLMLYVFDKTVQILFVRDSEAMLMETMTEFCNYLQEMDEDFLTERMFNKSAKKIKYKNLNCSGYYIDAVHSNKPKRGIANSRADLIIIFADERSQIDNNLFLELELSARSDKPGNEKLIVELTNPDGVDTEFAENVFNVLKLPFTKDELIEEEPELYKLKIVDDVAYAHCQCWANPFLTEAQKRRFREIEIMNPHRANVLVYGIPQALSGQVYDNLQFMRQIKDWEQETWQSLKIGVDIGFTDTDDNGGSTCVQVGLYSQVHGVLMVDGFRHNNKNDPLPTKSVFERVYNFVKEAYKKYSPLVQIKQLNIFVDETGAATWLESKRVEDSDPISANYRFKSTKDINKNSWPNKDRGIDVNSWIAMNVFSCLPNNQWLMDDLKKCVWLKQSKSNSEQSNEKIIRYHKYTDNLNAMEYAIWSEKQNMHDLAKIRARWRLEENEKQ